MQASSPEYIQVTAALIPRRGSLFIAQRPPNKKFGLMWEFPGGKVEAGESLDAALVREIREELCWEITVEKLFQSVRCNLHGVGIDLHAFWCRICSGELCLNDHVAHAWVSVKALKSFRFTEADLQIVLSLEKLGRLPG
ncbi:MAG: (deoxy)nucleoside triphosphate pyrophosphohydrolase [Syntrophobacteraceae bacterium]